MSSTHGPWVGPELEKDGEADLQPEPEMNLDPGLTQDGEADPNVKSKWRYSNTICSEKTRRK